MNWTGIDYQYMTYALHLARRGIYTTHPNPAVGCVLVDDNGVLAEGWHQKAGEQHAEVITLSKAGSKATGAVCYVTLEPCAHTGKTAPCTNALIKSGIKRVVIATPDPNPLVSGKGIKALEDAGIQTEVGLMQNEAQLINPGFEMRMRSGRPFVRCKLAMSLDGRTAMADGKSKWITSEASRKDVQRLRAKSSAIMTGIETIIIDNPALTVRDMDTLGRQPLRVIVDRELRTPINANILSQDGQTLIFTNREKNKDQKKLEDAGATVIRLDCDDKNFLSTLLRYLANDKEVNEILLESGATLAGVMLHDGLLDELIVYMAPTLLGHNAKALFYLPGIKSIADKIALKFTDIRMVGNDCRIILKPLTTG